MAHVLTAYPKRTDMPTRTALQQAIEQAQGALV